mmetsp:Transcript_8310/g.15047  ORF Transcript_8310/g.15047 Transcript_8310/m.15047 type:complete len:191 (-) Transcript_8310:694-1266(-)
MMHSLSKNLFCLNFFILLVFCAVLLSTVSILGDQQECILDDSGSCMNDEIDLDLKVADSLADIGVNVYEKVSEQIQNTRNTITDCWTQKTCHRDIQKYCQKIKRKVKKSAAKFQLDSLRKSINARLRKSQNRLRNLKSRVNSQGLNEAKKKFGESVTQLRYRLSRFANRFTSRWNKRRSVRKRPTRRRNQ